VSNLHLNLNGEYFDQIKAGTKLSLSDNIGSHKIKVFATIALNPGSICSENYWQRDYSIDM